MPPTPMSIELLQAMAAQNGYPYPDRAQLWVERLAYNAADLAAFRTRMSVDEAPLAAPPPPPAPLQNTRPRRRAAPGTVPNDLSAAAAAEIAGAVRARKLTPTAVAKHFIARIEAATALHAFTCVRPEQVMADARRLQRRIAAGEDPGPLAGVPVAIKDLMAVKGYPLTGGSRSAPPVDPAEDAPVVARLRAAGALIVGMANLHELAFGATSANPHFGAVGNPHYPGRIPGGSSGGSAAAVAAGLATIAVGTDTGGSIRIPAACCGMVGLKPSYGLVPTDGVMPLAWSLDHVGPIARSVADTALGFEVMAGRPIGTSLAASLPPKLRIGRPDGLFREPLMPDVRTHVDTALQRLAEDGAKVSDVAIAEIDLAPAIWLVIASTEATEANWRRALERPEGLGPDVRVRIEVGQFFSGKDYVKAQRLRRRLRDGFLAALEKCDVLVAPTMPMPAIENGQSRVRFDGTELPAAVALSRCTAPLNLAGLPTISLPCGRDRQGITIGLQIIGRPGAEGTVLQVAARLEHLLQTAM